VYDMYIVSFLNQFYEIFYNYDMGTSYLFSCEMFSYNVMQWYSVQSIYGNIFETNNIDIL
jgi:hypothetical protein